MKKNILNNTLVHECTSCQMCAAICPRNSIDIKLDEDGFYRPYVDNNSCTDCGLCVKICRKFDNLVLPFDKEQLSKTKLYAAFAKDEEVLKRTTSGGVADILAKQLVKDNYKVIGVVYNPEEDRAKHLVADSIELTDLFRGSKYIQSYSVDAFRDLVKNVRNEKYAVFGLPCQIYALDKFLKLINKRENCILIDLYCHGCPSMLAWQKYSSDRKKNKGVDTWNNVLWRSKIRGWGDYVLEMSTEQGDRDISRPLKNEFFDLFFSNQILNTSCTSCLLRWTLAFTDARLGDFWGKEFKNTFKGVSGVSLVTEQAISLFNKVKGSLFFEEKDYDCFISDQGWRNTYKVDEQLRAKILECLRNKDKSIKDCVNIIHPNKDKKVYIKHLLSYLPLCIEQKIRKIVKK